MSHIKPTVGRKIYFQPSEDQMTNRGGLLVQHGGGLPVKDRQPLDATINYVHSDTMIDITVNDHQGNRHFLASVILVPADGVFPVLGETGVIQGGYAYWMPFQASLAAASAAAEKAITDLAAAPAPGRAPATPFTSRFALGDQVKAQSFDTYNTATVTGVKFVEGKVLYDVQFGNGGPEKKEIPSYDVSPA